MEPEVDDGLWGGVSVDATTCVGSSLKIPYPMEGEGASHCRGAHSRIRHNQLFWEYEKWL